MLLPGSSGLTVRRARICVAGSTVERVVPRHREVAWAGDGDVDRAFADAEREIGRVTAPRFLASSVDRPSAPSTLSGPAVDTAILIVAGLALDIVEVEPERGLVAGEQEARQRGGDHDGIAHDDVARAACPTLSLLQATAMTLTVPVKAGIGNSTSAVPSGPTVTIPE